MFVVIDFDTQILLHLLKIQKVVKLFLFGGLPMLRTWRKEKSGKSFSLSKGNNSLVLTEEIKNRRKIDIGYIHIFSLFSNHFSAHFANEDLQMHKHWAAIWIFIASRKQHLRVEELRLWQVFMISYFYKFFHKIRV